MEQSITKRIKLKAIELGFSKIGVARAGQLNEEGKHFHEWLKLGYQASMLWMERNIERRIDPSNILPNVKSIICVAYNYYSDVKHSSENDCGKISRYAWGDDYHDVLINKLNLLLEYLRSLVPDHKSKIYVDTGPVMDKVWAVRAGIGWMGKHTNVITKDIGSWIFLGEILLDVELDYDEPILDHCGTCTACIDACPTQAIVQPYVVDSSRCISYLTIEHRGELSQEMAAEFQNWVYGCDICQDVCPWNRFQAETNEDAFKPRAENISPKLIELAEMSKSEFNLRFKRSPIKRTKHSGLTRNAKALLEFGRS